MTMFAITYYFLQVSLCSAVMFGYYWLVLRNKRFHQYNRFYLLTIALLSWVVPLFKIQWNTQATGGRQVMRFLAVIVVLFAFRNRNIRVIRPSLSVLSCKAYTC